MNDRSGLLTLAAYLSVAMVIMVVAAVGILKYGAPDPMAGLDTLPADPVPELAPSPFELPASSPTGSAEAGFEQQRLRLLESMLAEKTVRLRELSQSLMQQNAQYEDLKRRYDDAWLIAAESFAQPQEALPTAGATGAGAIDPTADDDRSRLEAQLAMARDVHEVTLRDLESLQNELTRVYEELERTRDEAGRESSSRLQEALTLEAATASVILRIGKDAVPALREALSHNSPIVRRWAATALGGIGPDAGDAVEALTETLTDSDPNVRRAAKTALDAIER